jgi:hypothetical protein
VYSFYPSIIHGFHGCDKELAETIFAGKKRLEARRNKYDWLGHGIYFWEGNPQRALQFAEEQSKRPDSKIKEPAVVGVMLDLGHCLNLIESDKLALLCAGYELYSQSAKISGEEMAQNIRGGEHNDLLRRNLDCAVIQAIHAWRKEENLRSFDSVRGVFWEGGEPYPNAGFRDKNHIQICIRNPNCIKGYFRPLEPIENHPVP